MENTDPAPVRLFALFSTQEQLDAFLKASGRDASLHRTGRRTVVVTADEESLVKEHGGVVEEDIQFHTCGTGALPPEEHAWQIGKTAASIGFVREAQSHSVRNEEEGKLLEEAINKIKAGKLILQRHLGVEELLAKFRQLASEARE